MAFQIVCIAPTYCQITDAMIGSHVTWRSHAYETAALPSKLVGKMAEIDEADGGDWYFDVVEFDASPFANRSRAVARASVTDWDEIPF